MNRYGYHPETGMYTSPCIDMETTLGHIALTWLNTRVRKFTNPVYDHIDYLDDDGDCWAFTATPNLLKELEEYDYPQQHDPIVDNQSLKWWLEMLTGDLNNAKPEDFNV
jgi:hypothetical protein